MIFLGRNKSTNFALLPQANHQRSTFDLSHSHKFTFNVGELIPFYWQEILPGTTVEIATSKLVRMQTPLYPIMDNMYLDTYYFFVPNRLIWDSWKAFQGENDVSKWLPEKDYHVPQATFPFYKAGGTGYGCKVAVGSVADYLGIPAAEEVDHDMYPHGYVNDSAPYVPISEDGILDGALSFSALPFRAYCQVINDWFRDQNLEDPQLFERGDKDVNLVYETGRFDADEWAAYGTTSVPELESAGLGGMVYTVNKFHDYFTSALPAPQKGQAVSIPVDVQSDSYAFNPRLQGVSGHTQYYISRDSSTGALMTTTDYDDAMFMLGVLGTGASDAKAFIDINSIRLAFAMQSQLELDARGGTRYTELIRSNFGIVSPDARLQRSEYLGGNHIPINVSQVVSLADVKSDVKSDVKYGRLGQTGAYSLTANKNGDFIQSFTEHGILLGVCVVRYDHSYQQGIARSWFRKDRFDYYMPAFANIGEQPVKDSEIFIDANSVLDHTFGFQEAWSEYRYMPNRVSGEMRSDTPFSLDVWHLADDYNSLPALSREWLKEDKSILDRCLAVTSEVANQFFADFFIDNKTTAPIPMYSIPAQLGHF